jgi:hypothetical protein
MARQKLNLHNAYVEGARLDAAAKLNITSPYAGRTQYASLQRRSEIRLQNAPVTIQGGVGVLDIGTFEDENIQLEYCALSLSLPEGYQAGLGRTEGPDLIPYTQSVNSRVETISSAVNGLMFLTSDTPVKLLIKGADATIQVTGSLMVSYTPMGGLDLSDALAGAEFDTDSQNPGQGGYEFTGGFTDRPVGQTGANDLGSNVSYTSAMAAAGQWYRFGFDAARQAANDVQYWGEDSPLFDQTKGLFGGLHMPPGVDQLFNFTDNGIYNQAKSVGDAPLYTAATGSYDFTDCNVGDLAKVRFSFNAVPQHANTTLEVGLIFATRDANDNITFTFPLTTQPVFYGSGSVGNSFLNRVEMSAYFASNEDVNARALPAIRADQEILIQPLSTLCTIVR